MSAADLDVGDRGPELGKAQKPAPHDQKQTPTRPPTVDGTRALDGQTADGKAATDNSQARRSLVADIETAGATPRAKPATIDGLVKLIRSYNPDADFEDIRRAYAFAEMAHEGQKRG